MAKPATTPKADAGGKGASKKVFDLAKKRWEIVEDIWADNTKKWLADAKFRAGDHWPEAIRKKREAKGQPCLVIDKLQQYVRQVVNDGRQNRPSIKVRPTGTGDEQTAEAFMGQIRDILDKSSADQAFDTSLDHAAGNGYGFFRVITRYAGERTFLQEIAVKRIRNPLTVRLGPFQEADASDAKYGFVIEDVPKEEFKEKHPQATMTDWSAHAKSYAEGWLGDKTVRVAEYWYIVEESTMLYLLADGTEATQEEYDRALAEAAEKPPQVVDQRKVLLPKVKFARMTGAEILEEGDWAGKYLPIIFVPGNESDVDGKVEFSGLVRTAKDPMRLYDYMRSLYAERVALAPKAPWVAAKGQTEDSPEWKTAHSENHPVLTYEPVEINGTLVPPPNRTQPSDIPTGFAQDMQMSERDIQGAVGMYNASIGERSNEKSGRAIMARQREGDTSTFHYHDNLNRAICHLGRILVDLIPKVYDSKRITRLVAEDGTSEAAMLDPAHTGAPKKIDGMMVYNLGAGRYDVTVTSGPSFTTKRQESVEAMMQLVQANPELFPMIGDIFVRNMDWPGSVELANRLKIMLPQPIKDAEAKGKDVPPEVREAMAQVEQQMKVVEQAGQQVQAAQQELAGDKAENEAERAKLDAAKAELAAQEKVLKANFEALSAKLELQATQMVAPPPAVDPVTGQPIAAAAPAYDPSIGEAIRANLGAAFTPSDRPDPMLALLEGMQGLMAEMRRPKRITRNPETGLVDGVV